MNIRKSKTHFLRNVLQKQIWKLKNTSFLRDFLPNYLSATGFLTAESRCALLILTSAFRKNRACCQQIQPTRGGNVLHLKHQPHQSTKPLLSNFCAFRAYCDVSRDPVMCRHRWACHTNAFRISKSVPAPPFFYTILIFERHFCYSLARITVTSSAADRPQPPVFC